MKRKLNQIKIAAFFAFVVFGFHFDVPATAQESLRQRVTGKPTPTVTPAPKQTPTPQPTVSPSPTLSATPVPIQSLADLQMQIRRTMARPEIRRGQVGVKIVSLDTGKVILEENAEKYFMPASNMKSFTIAAALEKLSPDFRFVTSVYAPAKSDANGVIHGDLTVYGRGDVSLSYSFYDGDYSKGLDALAETIAKSGVKRIEGNLIGDETYFSGGAVPAGWEWDDLQWYSGAEVSALPVNNNVIDLSVKPGAAGAPCNVQLSPQNTVIRVVNRCVTNSSGAKRDLRVFKKLDENFIEISGTMPADDKGFANFITVSHPAELFLAILRQLLTQKGVIITGANRVIGEKDKAISIISPPIVSAIGNSPAASVPKPAPIEIARLESPPLSIVAAKTMKPSQNLYTETILRALGEQMKITFTPSVIVAAADNPLVNPKAESSERGIFAVQNFLREVGIPTDSVVQHDGSGLSRHDLITPAAAVQLYTFMAKQSRNAQIWRDALPIAGVDGTLKNRFTGTLAAGNVRAKTGTIDQVSALSGYVTTASGERLVFSIIVNGVEGGNLRQSIIDEIVVGLANFNGKTY